MLFSEAGFYRPRQASQGFNNPSGGYVIWGQNRVGYSSSHDGYGGEATDPGYVECSGAIKIVFDWVPDQIHQDPSDLNSPLIDDPLDVPPAEVIIGEHGIAAYDVTTYDFSVDPAFFADNNLGFACESHADPIYISHGESQELVGFHYNGTSEGTRYAKATGGAEIEITCSPAALASNDGYNWASVRYAVAVINPRVSLDGVTRFRSPDALKFLTGQNVLCSIASNVAI